MTTSLIPVFCLLLLLVLLRDLGGGVAGFIWRMTDAIPGGDTLTFSERYMFASRKGPGLLPNGVSMIKVDGRVSAYMTNSFNKSVTLAYAIFHADDMADNHHEPLEGICYETGADGLNPWASNIVKIRSPAKYYGPIKVLDKSLGMNGTYNRWDVDLFSRYTVTKEGWHNVIFQFCGIDKVSMPAAKMDGFVTFQNPYGYLPAELFGLLPFEAARAVAFTLMGLIFGVLFMLYRDSAIPLHYAILFVFSVACIESSVWLAAYESINRTGTPYCCPFPPLVVAGLVLQIFRQTVSRSLLLIVSLGYGVVRPKMMPQEWTAVVVVSLLYFVASTVSQVSEIVLVNDVHEDAPQGVVWYQVPELVMDVIFLSWIYLALTSTIRILTEFKQSQKLRMYRWLTGVIYFFTFIFSVVTVVVFLNKLGYISWPWQWAWVQQVMWEVLNFGVISCVFAICRPSENSKLLAYASQLPTEDPDDDVQGEFEMIGTSIEDDVDDDQNGEQGDFIGGHGRGSIGRGDARSKSKVGSSGGKGSYDFDTLPESDDYGLDEDDV